MRVGAMSKAVIEFIKFLSGLSPGWALGFCLTMLVAYRLPELVTAIFNGIAVLVK
jgi:hypothetical protein